MAALFTETRCWQDCKCEKSLPIERWTSKRVVADTSDVPFLALVKALTLISPDPTPREADYIIKLTGDQPINYEKKSNEWTTSSEYLILQIALIGEKVSTTQKDGKWTKYHNQVKPKEYSSNPYIR